MSMVLFTVWRLITSYRILPFPNTGGKTHKIYNVFSFPGFTTFNPFKKETLKNKIIEYAKSEQYEKNTNSLFKGYPNSIYQYFLDYRMKIINNDFELLSIKYEEPCYEILVCQTGNEEATIVFKLNVSTDAITTHY